MKKYIIVLLLMVLIFFEVVAEIKNGYETGINETRTALENLNIRIEEDKYRDLKSGEILTYFQKKKLKFEIDSMKKFIYNHELTERLLDQFLIIAPELYSEIDTIKNAYGSVTDVYVKLIPDENMIKSQKGRTEIGQCGRLGSTCYSAYGIHSVSITIYTKIDALFILAHEFGHVKYEVPHLASYQKYFIRTYQDQSYEGYFIGHYPTDPSGKMALNYESRFRKCYKIYNKNT